MDRSLLKISVMFRSPPTWWRWKKSRSARLRFKQPQPILPRGRMGVRGPQGPFSPMNTASTAAAALPRRKTGAGYGDFIFESVTQLFALLILAIAAGIAW